VSTRTILEFNHDYLHDLNDEEWERLKRQLRTGLGMNEAIDSGRHLVPGVRVLAQRHHSEKITLKVE
jgi:hypothetical protein